MSVLISFQIFHPVGQNSVEWCADVFALLGHCVVSFWADVHCASVSRSPWDKNNSLSISVPDYFLSSAFAQLSASSFRHTHTHNKPIRIQERVTFAYLVSRVTRKKLSSGASIQLGRLLRIITPPLVLPLLLLRPLCCKTYIRTLESNRCSCRGSVKQIENKPTMRGPPVVPGFSAKTNPQQWEKEAKYTWGNLPVASSIDWFYFLS